MANNFSGDPNIVSVYRFEPGAMLVDSIVANGNDLTVYGSPPMQVDEVNFMEGAGSIYLNSASSDAVYRTDANLSTGHPLKSTTVSPKFSIAAWIRPAKFPVAGSNGYIITKTRTDINHRTFSLNWFGNRLRVQLGHGSSYEILVEDTTTTYTVGNWYHVAVTYDDTTKAWTVRVYDQTNNTTQNFNGTATSNIYMGTALFILGGQDNAGTPAHFSGGRLDEVVITKDVLTGTEIDQIRTGTYSAGGPIPLNAPTLSSPSDTATGQPLSVSLQWNDTNTDPQETQYCIHIKEGIGGTEQIYQVSAGVTSVVAATAFGSALIYNTTYYWQVHALGNGTTTTDSDLSAWRSFTTQTEPASPSAKPNRMLLLGVGAMSLLEKLRARKNKLSGGRS